MRTGAATAGLFVAAALLGGGCFCRTARSVGDRRLAELDAKIDALEKEFASSPAAPDDDEWVKRKLAHMVAVDQLLRNATLSDDAGADSAAFVDGVLRRLGEVDRRNTADLQAILHRTGWIRISRFGAKADGDAWLLVQHADHDRAFQREVLGVIEKLRETGETSRTNFAYLHDRVAVGDGRPQRFGTQGRCVAPGKWEPFPVEDPDRLDRLRAEAGLGPMAEYMQSAARLCR